MKIRLECRHGFASRFGRADHCPQRISTPWLGRLILGLLLLSPLAILAQVSAVDLAEWGQDKAAPRPAESAPGAITALDTGDDAEEPAAKAAETQPAKPRVAVYQFKVRGDLGIPDAGDIIGEWMMGALAATGRFTLMERVLLQKVFEENELQSSHLTDETTLATEAGRLYGVEAIVSGTAIRWGDTISIVARLIDTSTGVIRSAAEIKTNNRNSIPDQIDLLARKLAGLVPASAKTGPTALQPTEPGLAAHNLNSKTPEPSRATEKSLTIGIDEVNQFLQKWSSYQSNNNINQYLACYDKSFVGVKRTKTGNTYRYNLAEWSKDRSKMYAKAVNLSVTVDTINIDDFDNTSKITTISFMQYYSSKGYSDKGKKLVKIIKDNNGNIRIVHEELLYSVE